MCGVCVCVCLLGESKTGERGSAVQCAGAVRRLMVGRVFFCFVVCVYTLFTS